MRFFWQDGQPVVEWCQFGGLRWTAPFFRQSEQSARAEGCPLRWTPAEALNAWADAPPELPLAGMIFHLSRCGSTLVSRMLGALPANVVLSEPETLAGVLDASAWPPGIGDGQRIAWLRGLVGAYAARRSPEEQRLLIKLDPWRTLDLETIRAAFPGMPSVFIYRDPVEILVSLSDNVAGMFTPTPDGAARIGLTFVEALNLSSEEYCARVLGRVAEAAAQAARDPAWRLVNYTELPEAVETEIAPFFGLKLDEEARAAMRAVTPFHAKAHGRLVFRADAARKQRDADGELRELAQRWVTPAYARLEELRAGRR